MSECGKLDIISGRKAVCLCSFHNAVDHRAGLCTGRRVAEQPVLSPTVKGRIWFSARLEGCFSMEFCLLRLCIFQTALKNTFLWYYFLTLERAGKDMVSLGGSERIAEEYLIKIFEALFCAITILS